MFISKLFNKNIYFLSLKFEVASQMPHIKIIYEIILVSSQERESLKLF